MHIKRFALVLLFAVFASATARAQSRPMTNSASDDDEEEVVKVSTNLVTVPVSVKTRGGAYVTNLRREDFQVFEEGVPQEILHFETVDQPFTVALLLDVSDSTKADLKEIQDAAVAFLEQLKPNDRAFVVVFDRWIVKMTPPTGDRKLLADAIRSTKTGGGTALYDALDRTLNEFLRTAPGRKAVVVLTDGIDTSSVRANYEGALRSASEQCALIYTIQWDTPSGLLSKGISRADNEAVIGGAIYTTPSGVPVRQAYERGTRFLQLAAEVSGGRFQYANSLKNLRNSFERIAEELRQQYSLGYYPLDRGAKSRKRRIKVGVNVSGVIIRARESYSYSVAGTR